MRPQANKRTDGHHGSLRIFTGQHLPAGRGRRKPGGAAADRRRLCAHARPYRGPHVHRTGGVRLRAAFRAAGRDGVAGSAKARGRADHPEAGSHVPIRPGCAGRACQAEGPQRQPAHDRPGWGRDGEWDQQAGLHHPVRSRRGRTGPHPRAGDAGEAGSAPAEPLPRRHCPFWLPGRRGWQPRARRHGTSADHPRSCSTHGRRNSPRDPCCAGVAAWQEAVAGCVASRAGRAERWLEAAKGPCSDLECLHRSRACIGSSPIRDAGEGGRVATRLKHHSNAHGAFNRHDRSGRYQRIAVRAERRWPWPSPINANGAQ